MTNVRISDCTTGVALSSTGDYLAGATDDGYDGMKGLYVTMNNCTIVRNTNGITTSTGGKNVAVPYIDTTAKTNGGQTVSGNRWFNYDNLGLDIRNCAIIGNSDTAEKSVLISEESVIGTFGDLDGGSKIEGPAAATPYKAETNNTLVFTPEKAKRLSAIKAALPSWQDLAFRVRDNTGLHDSVHVVSAYQRQYGKLCHNQGRRGRKRSDHSACPLPDERRADIHCQRSCQLGGNAYGPR